MKAKFSEKQDTVKFTEIDGRITVQICLNESEKTVTPEEGDPYTEYEYDYNEWSDASENVDKDAIAKAPEDYIGYAPAPAMTAEQQRIADLEETVAGILGGEE